MSVGENLKKKRLEAGMSQQQLGEQVQVSRAMLCQIERGTKSLSLPLAKDIAMVLNCQLEDFLE